MDDDKTINICNRRQSCPLFGMGRVYVLAFLLLTLLMACGGDNDGAEEGSNNKTDVAVTGSVGEVGLSYAKIRGYVNLDKLPASVKCDFMGIEYSANEGHLGRDANRITTDATMSNNQFDVVVKDYLNPGETYYYRTFVKGDDNIYRYGKTLTFTTKGDFDNIIALGAVTVSYFSADIEANVGTADAQVNDYDKSNTYFGIAYANSSTRLTEDSLRYAPSLEYTYSQWGKTSQRQNTLTIDNLVIDTTYYYCGYTRVSGKYKIGEVKSFKTKSAADFIRTGDASNVGYGSATITGSLAMTGQALATAGQRSDFAGFIYSKGPQQLHVGGECSSVGAMVSEDGTFTTDLTTLEPGTTYYYRACFYLLTTYDNGKLAYGDVRSFTTKAVATSGYVDLGLPSGTKWAACNYGAATPKEKGTTMQWSGMSQRVVNAPTRTQIKELQASCSWTFYDHYNYPGFFVTGPNGNAMFLPYVSYWLNGAIDNNNAYYFQTSTSYSNGGYTSSDRKYNGRYVREVMP